MGCVEAVNLRCSEFAFCTVILRELKRFLAPVDKTAILSASKVFFTTSSDAHDSAVCAPRLRKLMAWGPSVALMFMTPISCVVGRWVFVGVLVAVVAKFDALHVVWGVRARMMRHVERLTPPQLCVRVG